MISRKVMLRKIQKDGYNPKTISDLVFSEIKGRVVQMEIIADEDCGLPQTVITATPVSTINVKLSNSDFNMDYFELINVSSVNDDYLKNDGLSYHPKNSSQERFIICSEKFRETYNPACDDLLLMSIRSIISIKIDDFIVYELRRLPNDGFDLFLNGILMPK